VIGSVERIPGLNWVVFTEISQTEALSATRTAVIVLVVVTLIVFVIILTAGSSLLRWLVFRPLASLRASLEQVAQGNFDVQVQVNRRDEVGEVTKAFNDMIRIVNERAIERERLIRELQAAKRMADENSRLKSEFLSTMSHELRTPMNAIEGFVGIILNRMGGTDYNDKTGTYLTRVRANSQRLLSLINDFLDLSRVESGRLDLASVPFEPRQLAERWRAELSVLAENKHIGFEFTVDPKLPKALVGDEEAISKVAINLISNAIKFTEQGAVTVEMQAAGDQWNIVVTDTGIGIPAHAREYVFEEFRQVDQTSKRKYGGTGLGLAIVQKYTRSMGGTVTLRSEVGLGSVFTISLPIVTVTQMKKLQEV
jgi:signal transduction histidine kinase